MNDFPQQLEKILLEYIKGNFKVSKKGIALNAKFNEKDFVTFSKGAQRLSEGFTSERGSLQPNYLNDPVLRSGYLLYFLPVNFLKIARILNEWDPSDVVSGRVRVLDLGSGPGTNMLGVMHFYQQLLAAKKIKDTWLDFHLVDLNFPALKDAQNLHDNYRTAIRSQVKNFESHIATTNYDLRRKNLKRLLRGMRYHIIVLSNFLNEIPNRHEQKELVQELIENHLEPKTGKLVVIEPALKKASRDLQSLRDEMVVKEKLAYVHAPCLHQDVCPLLVYNQRDWCHFYLDWECPKFIEKVDKLIGNKKEWLAMSYLVLSKNPKNFKKLLPNPEQSYRVISNLMKSKGKKEAVLCGLAGRYHIMKQDKDTTLRNQIFDRIRRGDIIELKLKDSKINTKAFKIDGYAPVNADDSLSIIRNI